MENNNTDSSHLFTDALWLSHLHKQKSQFIILIGTTCSSLPTNLVRVVCRAFCDDILLWLIMNSILPKGKREKKINSCALFGKLWKSTAIVFCVCRIWYLKHFDRNWTWLPSGVCTHLSMSENFTVNEIYEYMQWGEKTVPKLRWSALCLHGD